MRKNIANVLTFSRIILSVALLFCKTFSPLFYILYSLCGITDMTDGYAARKTDSVSEFGSRLDSAADAVFLGVCAVKILPKIYFGKWVLFAFLIILLIRIFNVMIGKKLLGRVTFLHTAANKVTGALLFCFAYFARSDFSRYFIGIIFAFALFASLQETFLLYKSKK